MWGEALGGAGTGAGLGFMVGGPVGAGVGAGIGGLMGLAGGAQKARQVKAQNQFEAAKTRYSPWTKAGIGGLAMPEADMNTAMQGAATGAGLYQSALKQKSEDERIRRGLPSARDTLPIVMINSTAPSAGQGAFSQGMMMQPK